MYHRVTNCEFYLFLLHTGLSGSEPSISTLVLGNGSSPYSDDVGQSGFFGEFPNDSDSSDDWEFSFPLPESSDVNGRLSE